MRELHKNITNDERGTTAIEFAIVGPVFIMLLIGILYLCMCLAVVGSMHFAVEEGARCASVKTTVCTDQSSTVSYTQNHYFGPGTLPTFTYNAAAACGHSVTGTINYVLDVGLKQFTVPVTASACFP
ncbi:MAG: TadE family protein [Pseudolabrys sp.]|jgi:Flp pilus assembly protein TadG